MRYTFLIATFEDVEAIVSARNRVARGDFHTEDDATAAEAQLLGSRKGCPGVQKSSMAVGAPS